MALEQNVPVPVESSDPAPEIAPGAGGKRRVIVAAALVLLALALAGAYMLFDAREDAPPQANIAPASGEEPFSYSQPGYTIEQVPIAGIDIASLAPSIEREVAYGPSIPAEARSAIDAKVAEIQEALRADIANVGAWFDLAVYYHTANDYDGAREVWEFLTKVVPEDPVAYENLGKLYHFSLKNYPQAEAHLKKALQLNPERTNPYIELAQLYQFSYKQETSALPDLLAQAMDRFPGNTDFVVMFGEYYERKGDTANARAYYTQALDLARDQGNLALVAAMGAKIEKL
jgi:tetratricopeptide (TPR) repeat protein